MTTRHGLNRLFSTTKKSENRAFKSSCHRTLDEERRRRNALHQRRGQPRVGWRERIQSLDMLAVDPALRDGLPNVDLLRCLDDACRECRHRRFDEMLASIEG